MANISLNIQELHQFLESTPASHNIMLVGNHGIGKSQILTNYFKEKGMEVVALFLGQMADPGDLIGLPNKDEKTGKTDFMPPYWFPIDGKPIVLFLDELNRARPEILQTIMDLALNRKLAGRHLPEGSRIISAVNAGDQYQLTDLDPALVSRFNIVNFKPTAEEWLIWAKKAELDSRVIDFISLFYRKKEKQKKLAAADKYAKIMSLSLNKKNSLRSDSFLFLTLQSHNLDIVISNPDQLTSQNQILINVLQILFSFLGKHKVNI